MSTEWTRARDERNRQALRRRTVYASYDYQMQMIEDIKRPALDSILVIISPDSSKLEVLRAVFKLVNTFKRFEHVFPEPQRRVHPETGLPYTWNPNSERLIELRDEFFTHCKLGGIRERILRAGINFFIIMYDYDPPYRFMIEWWAKKLEIYKWTHDIPVKLVGYNWKWWKE